MFDDKGNTGSLIMMVLFVVVILVAGAYGAVMLQKADAGYNMSTDTTIGQTAETNSEIMAAIMGAWPILAIIGLAILIVGALAVVGGPVHGR